MPNEIVVVSSASTGEVAAPVDVATYLDNIRPEWKSRQLINRVQRLLPIDVSSACQRLLNAAFHDLRDKVIIAGVDIARDIAKEHKLPPIEREEDIEGYSTAKLIDLSYRMGLLSRSEFRQLSRCYEIRRDLEHEDDEYEASKQDLVYIFVTSIDVVLAKDPTHLLKITDVKDVVEASKPIVVDASFLIDYEALPDARQFEISKMLVSTALDSSKPELVRRNAYTFLHSSQSRTQNSVKLKVTKFIQDKIGRNPLDFDTARVANATGTLSFMPRTKRDEIFRKLLAKLKSATPHWSSFDQHGCILKDLQELGGLVHAPSVVRKEIVQWLIRAYVGEPGGYGTFGRNRTIFYSDTAAPIIEQIVVDASELIKSDLEEASEQKIIKSSLKNESLRTRYDRLLQLT